MTFTKLYDVVMSMFIKGRPGERAQPRGVLVCYVHEDGSLVRPGLGVGVVSLHDVFVQRPYSCRFAIMKVWSSHDLCHRFLVIDMYDVRTTTDVVESGGHSMEFFVGDRWEFPTEEAALACAQMQL